MLLYRMKFKEFISVTKLSNISSCGMIETRIYNLNKITQIALFRIMSQCNCSFHTQNTILNPLLETRLKCPIWPCCDENECTIHFTVYFLVTLSFINRFVSRHVRHTRIVLLVGIAKPQWREKHFQRMRNPQFHVSDKRPIPLTFPCQTPIMMTSSNGNIFRATGHLCGEFTTQRPVTQSFDVYFDLRPDKRLSK